MYGQQARMKVTKDSQVKERDSDRACAVLVVRLNDPEDFISADWLHLFRMHASLHYATMFHVCVDPQWRLQSKVTEFCCGSLGEPAPRPL